MKTTRPSPRPPQSFLQSLQSRVNYMVHFRLHCCPQPPRELIFFRDTKRLIALHRDVTKQLKASLLVDMKRTKYLYLRDARLLDVKDPKLIKAGEDYMIAISEYKTKYKSCSVLS